ncbi:MAG: phosphoribosylformylglycinamidine synthase subunit PurQ [Actinomycetota bacterium]
MRVGVVTFPGSNDDRDALHAVAVMGGEPVALWHNDADLKGVDAVVLPGGFSYGDYLRTGAIARFAPVMGAVCDFAESGGPVLGICNGFQILCEAGLLPGALLRNSGLAFICRWVHLRVESAQSRWSRAARLGEVIRIPIKHGEGRYYADAETLKSLEDNDQVVLRYCDESGRVTEEANPNGSFGNIAGIRNSSGNVLGMMPHPEHAVDSLLGPTGGRAIFGSLISEHLAGVGR